MIIPDHIPKYNQSVNYSVNLDCSPKDTWSIISTKSHLELFHPFCEKNPVKKWPGKGAVDELQYLNGWLFERNFLNWYENEGYDLLFGRKYGRQSYVSWRIAPTKYPTRSRISITIYPFVFNTGSKFFQKIPFSLFVKPQLDSYLRSVLGGLQWYVINQTPISRNHFGIHKWFSSKKGKK